jgi:flavin-dependent dehydrogenase
MPDLLVLHPDEAHTDLIRLVHPRDWQNPRAADSYNLVVVGGGTAGLVAAVGAAILGARAALVERHLLGGDCLNTGVFRPRPSFAPRVLSASRGARGNSASSAIGRPWIFPQ